MWTEADRRKYRQEGDRLPSDLSDGEWERLEPLIPQAKPGGRPRKTDMRSAMNAIFYLLRTGCPWRYLPPEVFPPRSTVYNIFRAFQRDGAWEAIWAVAVVTAIRINAQMGSWCFIRPRSLNSFKNLIRKKGGDILSPFCTAVISTGIAW